MMKELAILISFAVCAVTHAGWTCGTFGVPTDWQVRHSDSVIVGKATAVHEVATNAPPWQREWPQFTVQVLESVCGSNLTGNVRVRMHSTSIQTGQTAVIFMYYDPITPFWGNAAFKNDGPGWTSTDVITSENAKVFEGQTFLLEQFPDVERRWQNGPVSNYLEHVRSLWRAIRVPEGEKPYLETIGFMKNGKRVYPWPPQQPPAGDVLKAAPEE